eukprot:1394392-Amorphochlora_amoeboformis.AAC.3
MDPSYGPREVLMRAAAGAATIDRSRSINGITPRPGGHSNFLGRSVTRGSVSYVTLRSHEFILSRR